MIFKLLRDGTTAFCFLVILLLIAAKVDLRQGFSASGVFYVIDGDTVSHNKQRLRLKGIDAPEMAQTCERSSGSWSCGVRARAALAALLGGKTVRCEGDSKDKYGRQLVVCHHGHQDLNAEMVRQGFAVAFGAYEMQEREAQHARRGVWAGQFMRPVDWRRSQNQNKRASQETFFN